ncbi:hypothetical protein Glove_46g53 [Diversispora epigaea]|uniref:Uncharacterized protein n=1 Tax=Diversispora epigaea TaxID=1348612 RepID=A0A397JPB6_9GLOM|nr:hypothetical protein Glove_46g53 [Diversispora epigaea]
MYEIGVTSFKFIPPEKKTKCAKWNWCILMGPSKLKIIEKFPFSTFINGQRGKDIKKLWRDFYNLYCTIKSVNLTTESIAQFSYDAQGDNPILQNNDIIKIKLGGDGRQVGRICLYPGTENHESLTIAHKQIIEELTILHNNGFKDNNNIHWKVEFWFTADWKYMALILGINGPTSNYFCLWCECHKNERWDMNKNWLNVKNTKGKIRTSLLPFLTIKYCVPDELHLMLRIVDVLLELFFMELMRDPLAFDKIQLHETMST